MDGATLVTTVCTDFLNVGGTDYLNAARRLRVLRAGQRAVDQLWGRTNWPFKRTSSTVAITSGAYEGDLPANYLAFGQHGGVFLPNNEGHVDWAPAGEIERLIQQTPQTGNPRVYHVIGQNTSGVKQLRVWPAPDANMSLTITYDKRSPTLTDAAAPSGLEEIPAQWHYPVVYEWVCLLLMRKQGDSRSGSEQLGLVERAVAEMMKAERPAQEAALYLPSYGDGYGSMDG